MGINVALKLHLLIGPLAALVSLLILKPLATRFNLLDNPGGRKTHGAPTPLIGGIALFIGLTMALLYDVDVCRSTQTFWFFSAMLVLVGVIDDWQHVSARTRLIVQTIAAIGVTLLGNIKLDSLGPLFFFMPAFSSWAVVALSVVFIITFVNAMNMLDGLDGLVGGIAFGEGLLLWFLSFRLSSDLHHVLTIFLCTLFVFIMFNVSLSKEKQARVFLGDAGSTFIAFLLVWVGITLSQHEQMSRITPITILWCLLLPFMDLLSVCIIRFSHGKSWLEAGHEHIHHILQRLDLSRLLVSAIISALSLGIGLVGLGLAWWHVSEDVQLILMVSLVFLYLVATYQGYQFVSSAGSKDASMA